MRLIDLAQTLVQFIVRNLFERTADVRWWATDHALWSALEDPSTDAASHAASRLGVINRFYNRLSRPRHDRCYRPGDCFRQSAVPAQPEGQEPRRRGLVQGARGCRSGDDYVVDRVRRSPLHDQRDVLVYATGIRAGGRSKARLSVRLGSISTGNPRGSDRREGANLPPAVAERTEVLLLDGTNMVIASSRPSRVLYPFRAVQSATGTARELTTTPTAPLSHLPRRSATRL